MRNKAVSELKLSASGLPRQELHVREQTCRRNAESRSGTVVKGEAAGKVAGWKLSGGTQRAIVMETVERQRHRRPGPGAQRMLPSCCCFQRHHQTTLLTAQQAVSQPLHTIQHLTSSTSRQPDDCHPYPMQPSAVKRQRGVDFGCVPSKGCASWKQHQSGGWPCSPE